MCGSMDVATELGLRLGTGLKLWLRLQLGIVFKAVIFNQAKVPRNPRVPRAFAKGSAARQ